MKKFLICAISLAMASPVLANPAYNHFLDLKLSSAAFPYDEASSEKKIENLMSSSPQSWKDFFSAWSYHERQSENPSAWGNIGLAMLRIAAKDSVFVTGVESGGYAEALIFQQDALLDTSRVQAYQVDFPTIEVAGYVLHDTANPSFGITMTSSDRMKMGMAPIAPDNSEIEVCSMGRSSSAPYLEMSKTQKDQYSEVTGLNFGRCLQGQQASIYWSNRAKGLDLQPYGVN